MFKQIRYCDLCHEDNNYIKICEACGKDICPSCGKFRDVLKTFLCFQCAKKTRSIKSEIIELIKKMK